MTTATPWSGRREFTPTTTGTRSVRVGRPCEASASKAALDPAEQFGRINMSSIVPRNARGIAPRASRYTGRALARIDSQTELGLAQIEAQAELQVGKVQAVGYVCKRAMHEVAMVSQLEQQLATLVPMATARLQAMGDMAALDMADVVGDTVRRVSR
jgi:hypothetical protein